MAPMVDAAMPKGKGKDIGHPGSIPCPQCGDIVLEGVKDDGTIGMVERLNDDSYCAQWDSVQKVYRLKKSGGYPVHRCAMTRKAVRKA